MRPHVKPPRPVMLVGPPEGGGAPVGSADHHHHPITTRHHPSGTCDLNRIRQCRVADLAGRRGAELWRDGFCHGFLDALRCAARRTDDPEVWGMLSRLAEEYTLAGGA
jgi:hypothetical protein